MGVTALVLGILAFLASLIPLLSLFTAIPLALLGVIFAIVGYVRISSGKATNKTMTTFGLVLSVLAIIGAVLWTMLAGAILGSPDSTSTTATQSSGSTSADDSEPAMDNDQGDEEGSQENLFSGQQPRDEVGEAGETLHARGVTVTAEPIQLEYPSYSDPVLCSHVTYENNTDERLDYHEWDWSLQSPSGDIKSTSFSGVDERLSAGDLAPEGTTSGYICFDNTNETGEHVLLFEGFITVDSSRGAWINEIE